MAPQDYSSFVCIADRCKHSCCMGWEIDIDAKSLERYRSLEGRWQKRMTDFIVEAEDGTASFRLTSEERCPFLQQNGLCELILHFGEDILCQICSDHPRFRHFYADRIELGLGLCCEEAARLTLMRTEPMRLVVVGEDNAPETDDADEKAFLNWRNRLLECAEDRSVPIIQRVQALHPMSFHLSEWKAFLLSLERMDDAWAERLNSAEEKTLDGDWEIPLEQLLVYLLYRHLSQGFEEGDTEGRLAFSAFSWQLVYQLFASSNQSLEELIEIVRLFSSELEYSEENVDAIIVELERRGKEKTHEFS